MSNLLKGDTSPYLLQHMENPVDWYPWGPEAFQLAKKEDKPIFLSIGYSTCHWCHVMAHESFEDAEIAAILNRYFVSIKVDKEERPDIDSIYMAVCQTLTGSGGWPMSIFMTADQKPFYAGTYFPKVSRYGSPGLKDLLLAIQEKWQNDRASLLRSADHITDVVSRTSAVQSQIHESLPEQAVGLFRQSFSREYGGFGGAPKFPSPHNLMFLMQYGAKHRDPEALRMAEITLRQMYLGGLFDHIGYGFCRYSTDQYYLVPHFEKMLYDNALLILAYCRAYDHTNNRFYLQAAEKTAFYLMSEMTSTEGAFYSAQDADSDGEEGKYYVFRPEEIKNVLGSRRGKSFCAYFDITERGNFEGNSIPNLLSSPKLTDQFDQYLPALREYRKKRAPLHTDDKILTSWNCLAVAALCSLYRSSRNGAYLQAVRKTMDFLEKQLCEDDVLYVSWRNGIRKDKGFLDDYASWIFALLSLYDVTLDPSFLLKAEKMTEKTIQDFFDQENGGFYLYGKHHDTLIFRTKETYDGAIPSGNSLMAYNLVRLSQLKAEEAAGDVLTRQLQFLSGEAKQYPTGASMFLMALSDYLEPPETITVVLGSDDEDLSDIPFLVPPSSVVRIVDSKNSRRASYPLLHGQTTFYVCRKHSCLPPVTKEDLRF